MFRLSLIIGEIYNKYLPLAEKGKIQLNLDFSDTTKEVPNPDQIRQDIEQALDSAFQRTDHGEISVRVNNSEITITDSGTVLSKTACALLSGERVQVKSRIGFGTTVRISLNHIIKNTTDKTSENITTTKQTSQSNTEKTKVKPTSNSKVPTKSPSREIVVAAAKTDKKVQKIAEKAKRRLAKHAKTAKKSTKATAGTKENAPTPAKKRRIVHKLDFS